MELKLVAYLANALWLGPLLAGGAWCLLRLLRLQPQVQYAVWMLVLLSAVVLPARSLRGEPGALRTPRPQAAAAAVKGETPSVPMPKVVRAKAVPGGTPHSGMPGTSRAVRRLVLRRSESLWVVCLYLGVVFFHVLRLARRWATARHLVRSSSATKVPLLWRQEVEHYAQRMGAAPPELRLSVLVTSPAVAGVIRPCLLLPPALRESTTAQRGAVFCHEIAHLRRRDSLAALVSEMAAIPVAWHPATAWVKGRLARAREMACDELAAGALGSPAAYARSLLEMAQTMQACRDAASRAGVVGLWSEGFLEERIMQLTAGKRTLSGRVWRVRGAGAAVVLAATTLAMMNGLRVEPVMAATEAAPLPQAGDAGSAARGPRGPVAGAVAPTAAAAPSSASAPTAIAHGRSAHVRAKTGSYTHRWTGEDGEPFVIANEVPQEPSPGERRRIEAEFRQQMAATSEQLAQAGEQLTAVTAQIDSPEFDRGMKALSESEKDLSKQLAAAELQLNNPQFQRQMREAMRAAADAPRRQKQVEASLARVNSPEFQSRMRVIQVQIEALQRQMSDVQGKMQQKIPATYDLESGDASSEPVQAPKTPRK